MRAMRDARVAIRCARCDARDEMRYINRGEGEPRTNGNGKIGLERFGASLQLYSYGLYIGLLQNNHPNVFS